MNNNTVEVKLAERSYDIIFSAVDSEQCIAAFTALPQKNVLVVADSNTAQYLPRITGALKKSGKQVYSWTFPAGENSKTMDNVMALCSYAASLQFGRNALFAALGGGVTGDMTGFAASIFMRGIGFIQIPTSLLAMVDSSVGGKTAVDTPFGKNLIGAFHQPELVVIDTGFLQTLPAREIRNGLAEIIKTAMISDRDFAGKLTTFPENILADSSALNYAIRRSCEIKAMVVAADEKESGDSGRVFLNYGHTFGHAIEHLSGFRIAHGEAVAIGMDIAAYTAVKQGLCEKAVMDFQHALLDKFAISPENIRTSNAEQDIDRIIELMKGDKKNGDGKFRAVLPLTTGNVRTVDLDPQLTASILHEYFTSRSNPAPPAEKRPEAAIIGLGLLGSSLARSLDRNKYLISAWNRDQKACKVLSEQNFVEKIHLSPEQAFAQADIVILCLPIPVTTEFIRKYHGYLKPGAVATDIASVKGIIMETADSFTGFNFVGSHPMAGTEKSGYQSGFTGLYNNADVFIVPGKNSSPEGIGTVEKLWLSLKNTHVCRISASAHDALVARTSHVQHIIASSLTRSILDRENVAELRQHFAGCASGFRDTSRIASSSPEMWQEICLANQEAILPALEEFQSRLEEMRRSLIKKDPDEFAGLFRCGKNLRDSWLCYQNAGRLPANIVLCGIKHCGKSSVGTLIAAMLNIPFIDTDDEIVKSDGKNRTAREIFKDDGEKYFRKLEAQVLENITSFPGKAVIALGGGSLSNPMVSAEVKNNLGFKIFLDAGDKVCFERICAEKSLPPFLADAADPFAAFTEMNKHRREIFSAECDVRIEPCGNVRLTALQILSVYKNFAGF